MGASANLKYHHSQCFFTNSIQQFLVRRAKFGLKEVFGLSDLCGRQSQVGSLAGAAHLLKGNAGVLR